MILIVLALLSIMAIIYALIMVHTCSSSLAALHETDKTAKMHFLFFCSFLHRYWFIVSSSPGFCGDFAVATIAVVVFAVGAVALLVYCRAVVAYHANLRDYHARTTLMPASVTYTAPSMSQYARTIAPTQNATKYTQAGTSWCLASGGIVLPHPRDIDHRCVGVFMA